MTKHWGEAERKGPSFRQRRTGLGYRPHGTRPARIAVKNVSDADSWRHAPLNQAILVLQKPFARFIVCSRGKDDRILDWIMNHEGRVARPCQEQHRVWSLRRFVT